MGYTALYRKFRPLNFSEMVGQEHITKTLKNQVISGRVGHAYLFNGGRGTGKTSSAKILARAINCLNPKDGEPCNECEICKGELTGSLTDIVEMDAASNNSVEDVRQIREEVNFLPTKAKYRIYIIDEVHMLSTGAFNALLKTLEEPPEHVKFILATTEPQKIPATILSRCQRFDFKKISNEDIIKRLKIVCKESDIEITDAALNIIAVLSEGAMRDALSILERCVQDGNNNIDEDKIKDLVGIPKITYINSITDAIIKYDIDKALENIKIVLDDGKDITNLIWEMIKYIKDILVYKSSGKADLYSKDEVDKIKEIANGVTKERLVELIYELSELESKIKTSTQKTIVFEAGMIRLCNETKSDNKELEKRIEKIENYLKSGTVNSRVTEPRYNEIPKTTQVSNSFKTERNTVPEKKNVSNSKKTYTGKVEEFWPRVVDDLRQSGKIVLYTNLMGTTAKEINDMTVGIEFPRGMTPFGKAILQKQENIKEISNLVSIAYGKQMNIKYIVENSSPKIQTREDDLQNLAKNTGIEFNVIDD